MKLLFFILFLPISSFGQHVYEGVIIDENSKMPVPYATVGLIKENTGINANEKGIFKLTSFKFNSDTLYITSIGYLPLKMPIDKFTTERVFEMKKNEKSLSEIIIKSNFLFTEELNSFSNCGLKSVATARGAIVQIAQLFETKSKNTLLEEVIICKWRGNCKFRIRVYDYDSVFKMPAFDLVDSIIEVETSKKFVSINLLKYNIVIPNKKFYIAIEWLHIPENETVSKTKINNEKVVIYQYEPMISYKERKQDENFNNSDIHIWQLNFNGYWKPFSLKNKNLMISVKTKY